MAGIQIEDANGQVDVVDRNGITQFVDRDGDFLGTGGAPPVVPTDGRFSWLRVHRLLLMLFPM
jgi:hypothetical protein